MIATDAKPSAASTPRKASREFRREQLLEATIETLASRGHSRTTLAEVATAAEVSHGLVIFHFQSKERLLVETLLYLSNEYRENWMRSLAAAGSQPAEQLDALIRADFDPRICAPNRLKAWCAFWGEAQNRPIYQEQCGSNDLEYVRMLEDVCARLGAEGGYRFAPEHVARVLRVTIEGVWLDMITMTAPYSRDEALRTVHICAAAFYPKHFDESGLIAAEA